MNDEELIAQLRRHRPLPPLAPEHEWNSIARRTRPLDWRWAWGSGLALAALSLVVLPVLRQAPAAQEEEGLAGAYLAELREGLDGPVAQGTVDETYLALLSASPD